MKKLALFSLVVLMSVEISAQTYPKPANAIRLLTYNTAYCRCDNNSISLSNTQRVASVVRALNPDIVSLQELDSASNSRGKRDLLKQIADATFIPFNTYFGKAAAWDGGYIGPGVLVRNTFKVNRFKRIVLPGDEARSAVRVDMDQFTFMGTHFDLNDNKRIAGASLVVNELDYIPRPTFLAGDLNDSHRWGGGGIAFPVLTGAFTIVSDVNGNSIPNRTDNSGLIDYILYRDYNNSPIQVIGTQIVRTLEIDGVVADLKYISDHYPVFVDIMLSPTAVQTVRDHSIQCYPNPTRDRVFFSSESDIRQIRLFSMEGKLLSMLTTGEINQFDLSACSPGVYWVELLTDQGTERCKIIKE